MLGLFYSRCLTQFSACFECRTLDVCPCETAAKGHSHPATAKRRSVCNYFERPHSRTGRKVCPHTKQRGAVTVQRGMTANTCIPSSKAFMVLTDGSSGVNNEREIERKVESLYDLVHLQYDTSLFAD